MGNAYGHSLHKPDGVFSSLVSGPATALISTAEAKDHLRVDGSDEDTLIDNLVQAATDYMDAEHGILGRALITQRWQLTLAAQPSSDHIHLPIGRVQQVATVKYYDTDNVEQTLSSADYRLVTNDEDAIIELVSGASWPSVYDRADAFWVQYDTGYGDAASDVPQAIRQAALLLIGLWFEDRVAASIRAFEELPFGVRALLANFRVSRSFM